MSVAGHLSPGGTLPRMSRAAARELGARFDGAVLSGELSLVERFVRDAAGVLVPDRTYYCDVEEYDRVLRAHCRLDG